MNLYEILNILILALSLATVILTMMAYIHHQARRLRSEDFENKKNKFPPLKASFFKRYAPHIEEQMKVWEEKQEKDKLKENGRLRRAGFVGALGMTTIVLVAAFFYIDFSEKRTKGYALETKGEQIEELINKGLLEKYSYSPSSDLSYEFSEPDRHLKPLQGSKEHLQSQLVHFILSGNDDTDKAWTSFFDRMNIKAEKLNSLDKIKLTNSDKQLILIPRVMIDGPEKPVVITELLSNQVPLVLYEQNTSTSSDQKESWLQKELGLNIREVELNKKAPYLQFTKSSYADYPPGKGIKLNVSSDRVGVVSLSAKTTPLALLSTFNAHPFETELAQWDSIAARIDHKASPLYWIGFNPHRGPKNQIVTESDFPLSHILALASRKPMAVVDQWPDSKKSVAVVSVDVEDEFENIEGILELFTAHQIRSTLFVVSELYEEYKKNQSEEFLVHEIASHGNSHDSFKDQSELLQFKRLQDSRHQIETITGQSVQGFRPPYEEFDPATLYGAEANRIKYFFGDQSSAGLVPFRLTEKLLFIPRHNKDDYALKSDRTLVSPKRITAAMIKDVQRSKILNGGYFVNFHSQIFGQQAYLGVIDALLANLKSDSDVKLMTFAELTSWWKSREGIEVDFDSTQNTQLSFAVHNKGTQEFSGSVSLYLPKVEPQLQRQPSSNSKLSYNCASLTKKGHYRCTLNGLSPGEKIDIPLRLTP